MIKVINISSRTIEINYTQIKPHKIQVFNILSDYDRAKLSALEAVGVVKVYEGDYSKPKKALKQEKIMQDNKDTTNEEKPAKKSNKKK